MISSSVYKRRSQEKCPELKIFSLNKLVRSERITADSGVVLHQGLLHSVSATTKFVMVESRCF